MYLSRCHSGAREARTRNVAPSSPDSGFSPAGCPGMTELLLLRLPLLPGTAGVAPGGEAAAHMGDRLQPHVLCGLGGKRRAQAAGAVEDELLVLLEDRLGVGAL